MLKGNLRAQWIELSLQSKKKNDKELKKNDKTHLKDKTHLSQKKKKKKKKPLKNIHGNKGKRD